MRPSSPSSATSSYGKPTGQVELRRDRLDAFSRERSDRVADQLLLGSEVEVHGARIVAAR